MKMTFTLAVIMMLKMNWMNKKMRIIKIPNQIIIYFKKIMKEIIFNYITIMKQRKIKFKIIQHLITPIWILLL